MKLFNKSVETITRTHWDYVGPGSEYVWIIYILVPVLAFLIAGLAVEYPPKVMHR